MAQHPEVLWAQRSSDSEAEKNVIYLTINLPDIHEQTLSYSLESKKMSFAATAGNASIGVKDISYGCTINFFSEIDPNTSSKKLSSRSLYFVLRKKEASLKYWPRLTSETARSPYIKTDYSKWVDEDEQDGNDHEMTV